MNKKKELLRSSSSAEEVSRLTKHHLGKRMQAIRSNEALAKEKTHFSHTKSPEQRLQMSSSCLAIASSLHAKVYCSLDSAEAALLLPGPNPQQGVAACCLRKNLASGHR